MPKRKADAPAVPEASKKAKKGAGAKPHIVLAHSAGHHPAGGKHPAMQRWASAFRSIGQVHDTLVYPKPFNLMPRLVDAHVSAIGAAVEKGGKSPVVLVGVGMGARVAVHLLSGAAGDDGKPLGTVPDSVKASIKACVCIDYPLLRVGTREARTAPLLAVPASGPKMLFVRGPEDKHMDASKLPLKRLKAPAAELLVAGKSESPSAQDIAAVVKRVATMV